MPRLQPLTLGLVFVGGVCGGLLRYAISLAWPPATDTFPWATFSINTSGAFALGLLLVVLAERLPRNRFARPLLGTGLIGAFTTFSSVMTATDELAAHGHGRTALAYLLGSLAAALGAVWVAMVLGRRLA